MKTIGIICEYNPFHRGHQAQFRRIRAAWGEDTAIVCLMSGDFVQRGEPALYPKEVRAKAAVLGGADLVLELPVTVSLRSAEGFADGGVAILSKLGAVDGLSFGCESKEGLLEAARLLLSEAFPAALKEELKKGVSFAAARQRALVSLGGRGEAVSSPNNILAVEYMKAALRRQSPLTMLPMLRPGGYHDALPHPEHPSAASLRACGDFLPYVPEETRLCYEGQPQYRREFGERAMLARLRAMGEAEFAALPYGSEGLGRKVRRACLRGGSVEGILHAAKSKRYAMSRLSRMLLCAYLGITEEMLAAKPPYVRVLALSGRGRAVLRQAKARGTLRLLHGGEKAEPSPYEALEKRCALLYDLFSEESGAMARRNRQVFLPEKT